LCTFIRGVPLEVVCCNSSFAQAPLRVNNLRSNDI
jgi:hypothetical protein